MSGVAAPLKSVIATVANTSQPLSMFRPEGDVNGDVAHDQKGSAMAHSSNTYPYTFVVTSKGVPVAAFADGSDATAFGVALASQDGKKRLPAVAVKCLRGRYVYVSLANEVKRNGRLVAGFDTYDHERLFRSLSKAA